MTADAKTPRFHDRGCRWVALSRMLIPALIVVLWSTAAWGYLFNGAHLLELMTRTLEGAKSLIVTQHLTIEDPLISAQPVEMREELKYFFPDRFRSEIRHADFQRILVVSRGAALTIADGRITAFSEGRFERYKDLLLYRSRKLLHKALLRYGVDTGITSLGRMGTRVVYVIGAQYPDDAVSQLWIDKERLLPLRWLSVLSASGLDQQVSRLEFIYANWVQPDKVWYPMRIEALYNGRRMRTLEVSSVQANAPVARELFNIANLMMMYTVAEESQSGAGNSNSAVDEVERTIEEFRRELDP